MTDGQQTGRKTDRRAQARDARLSQALRDNLQRRKDLVRARKARQPGEAPGASLSDPDPRDETSGDAGCDAGCDSGGDAGGD